MTKSSHPERKKLHLINRDFQLRYTWAMVVVSFLSTSLTAFALLYPLYVFEILYTPRFLPLPILLAICGAILVNMFFLYFMGIWMTHRIAGPMYSLMRHLRIVGMGFFGSQIKLRDEDEMKFVVRHFNEMIESLQKITSDDLSDILFLKQETMKLSDVGREIILAKINLLEERTKLRLHGDEPL